ncbi:preprotein translocase subunit SecE [Bdellovibrionota bacterium FG-1]
MESQYQKWVNTSYLALAVLVGYVVFSAGLHLGGAFDLEARIRNFDLVVRGLSVLAGLILFMAMYRHQRANQFMNEVMTELARVTWPTQKETTSATFVVIIMVVLSGMFLGFLDYIWTALLKMVV